MTRQLCWMAVLVAALAPAGGTRAAEKTKPAPGNPAVLAATIDRLVGDKLKAANVIPAPPADDATFFRRINLAIAGRVPMPSEVRVFLADRSSNKRAQAVDRLLNSAAFTNYMTASWRGWLLPEAATTPEVANLAPAFESWLRHQVRDEIPFDRIVTDLLTYPLDGVRAAGQAPEEGVTEDGNGPLAFYTAKEGKPENLAASTARVFLGVHLECAQCHDHPFARWRRDQFWGLAAFYGGVERPTGGGFREMRGGRELLIPNSDKAVPATFLDDKEPEWQYRKSPRATLASWLTSPENPFFARAIANRLWWLVFGVGLVDPVDDFHDQNPPSHPDLLAALSRAFVESGFDLKFILRGICQSETFARSSVPLHLDRSDVRLFAYFPMQGLSAEQLFDSLAVVLGANRDDANGMAFQQGNTPRRQFLEAFAASSRQTEAPTTILQALTLMNGNLIGQATEEKSGRLLKGILGMPGLTPPERIETLYLAVLSRPPRDHEMERSLKHVQSGNASQAGAGYADVLWALLNGVEFRTNH